MDFVVIDVETANADLSSICQVGIASFRDGALAESWVSLVDPKDHFSSVNVSIHGIDNCRVIGAPTWPEVFPSVASRLREMIVVSHTHFDRVAVERACIRSNLTECTCNWLDSARVVRIAWPEFSRSGYGLSNVASHFGITYQAHDALEDARCAGMLLLRAVAETGLSVQQWLVRAGQPIHTGAQTNHREKVLPLPAKRDGNPEGRLSSEVLVFTGSLSIPRAQAAEAAAEAGCRVEDGVTKHTTMLVVGDQDIRMLAGHEKSSKHMKAERLIIGGQHIRIIGESDFMRIVTQCPTPSQSAPNL